MAGLAYGPPNREDTSAQSFPLTASHDAQPKEVSVHSLGHRYIGRDAEVQALSDVSFTVGQGESVCIIGPSGCGKSTLLKIIGGLIIPTSGSVNIGGRETRSPRDDLGYMFQDATLLPWRTALDNVLLPLEIRMGRRNITDDHRGRALDLLRSTGLSGFEASYPGELSGGMAQRVAICRMLITDPSILLLDEPFGALDELTRELMNEDIQRVCLEREATMIMVTHSIPEAVLLSDRVFVMSARPGRIVGIIEVPFKRPRQVDITTGAEFGALVGEVRSTLGNLRSTL